MVVARLEAHDARGLRGAEPDGEDRAERDRHLAEGVARLPLADDALDPVDELDRLDPALQHGEQRALGALVRRVLARHEGDVRGQPRELLDLRGRKPGEERDLADLFRGHHPDQPNDRAQRRERCGGGMLAAASARPDRRGTRMTPAAAAPRLTDEQLLDFSGLVDDADSVELKLSVPERQQRSAVAALGLDPLDAQVRLVHFFDTPELDLERAGVVVRARRVQGKGDDSVVKLRPVVPSDLPAGLRRSAGFFVEVDAMPGGYVCSASLKGRPKPPGVREALLAGRPLHKLFSKEQRAFYAEHAPAGIALDDLRMLGPIFVLKLKGVPEGFRRRLVVELWLYPDGARILELSTKCPPSEAFQVAGELRTYLARLRPAALRRAADQDAQGARVLLTPPGLSRRERPPDPPFLAERPTVRAAVEYAATMHTSQLREADRAPFILHPLEVAALLSGRDLDDAVVAAGVLHDVVENTPARTEDVEARFGPRVAAIVAAVTEDPRIGDYGERKAALRGAGRGRRPRRAGGLRRRQDRQGARAARPRRERARRAVRPGAAAPPRALRAQPRPAARGGLAPADGRPARVRAVGAAGAPARPRLSAAGGFIRSGRWGRGRRLRGSAAWVSCGGTTMASGTSCARSCSRSATTSGSRTSRGTAPTR